MSPIEIAATIFGLLSVWFTVKEKIWCWPTGFIMVILYTYIFFVAKLYSDMGLQIVYIVMQIYGWYNWLHGGKDKGELKVTRIKTWEIPAWIGVMVVGMFVMGYLLHRFTDASLPFCDSLATTMSLVAQWLLTRKKLESWIIWITVDVLYLYIYYVKDLYLTTGLYAVFLCMATMGFIAWLKSYRRLNG
jgi:nicotinamide mononucleotide transporter